MAGKQAPVGLKDLHYAIATIAEDGTVTYEEVKKISDVQTATITPSVSTDKYYADDTTADIVNSFDGCTVELTTYGIKNSILAELEGHETDENGVTIEKADDEAPYIALGFRSKKRNGKYRYVWLLLGKKQLDKEEYESKQDKENPKSTTLTFQFVARADGFWRYRVDEDDENAPADLADKWFTQVYDGTWA